MNFMPTSLCIENNAIILMIIITIIFMMMMMVMMMMVIFTIRGGDGSVVDQSRRSPLHYAVEKGLTRIVQVLL